MLADALDERSAAVRVTASVLAWAAWSVVVLALLVRRPLGLTALRVVAPAALAASVWAAVNSGDGALLAALTAVPLLVAFLPEIGAWLVNGAAYGDERRYPLRAPGALLLGPLPVAWAVLMAGIVTGPLLVAAGQWIAGGVAVALGWAAAALSFRALQALSVRWAVLVPAGLVLKDHVTLLDPVLFKRTEIERLVPALADTDALDLTARSPGLAVELRLKEKVPLTIIVPGRRENQPGRAARLMFTPTRPGAFLADAGTRRIQTVP